MPCPTLRPYGSLARVPASRDPASTALCINYSAGLVRFVGARYLGCFCKRDAQFADEPRRFKCRLDGSPELMHCPRQELHSKSTMKRRGDRWAIAFTPFNAQSLVSQQPADR